MKYPTAITLFLLPLIARAVEDAPPPPAPVDASPWGMIIFALVFFGMIAGFGLFIWRKERQRQRSENQ